MSKYFVANNGNDANPGTVESPFKTFAHAVSLARAGDTVNLRGGDIFRESPVMKQSGTNGNFITIKSYGNGKAIISGAEIISDGWISHSKNIFKRSIPPEWNRGFGVNQFFLNGKLINEARWPKIPPGKTIFNTEAFQDYLIATSGSYDPKSGDANGYYTGSFSHPSLIRPTNYWVGCRIIAAYGLAWASDIGDVIASSGDTIQFKFKLNSYLDVYTPSTGNPFFLIGKLELVTEENEIFTSNNGTAYLYPIGGVLNANDLVEIRVRQKGIDFSNCSFVQIENLEFFACNINSSNCSNINIIGVDFKYSGYHNPECKGGIEAIKLTGDNIKIADSNIYETCGDAIYLNGNNIHFYNSVSSGSGYLGVGGDSIDSMGTNHIIEKSTIFNSGYHGICARAKASKYRFLRVFNIGRNATDLSGINMLRTGDMQGTEICYNCLHDGLSFKGELDKIHFNGCQLIRTDSGGQKPQEGTSNVKIHHNIGYRTTNNCLALWPLAPWHTNYGNTKIEVYCNSFDGSISFATRPEHINTGTIVMNNIARIMNIVPSEADIKKNLFEQKIVTDNLSGYAGFISPWNYNFMLRSDSPCIKAGVRVSPYTDDCQDSAPHLGAIEFGATPFVAGAVIGDRDIPSLQYRQDRENPYKIYITGLPIGRNLPSNFKIKSGDGVPSGNFYNVVDPTTGLTTGIAFINDCNSSGTIGISLDGTTFHQTNKQVDLDDLSIANSALQFDVSSRSISMVTEEQPELVRPYYRIPIQLSNFVAAQWYSKPVLLRINTANLIADGLMQSDCRDLRIVNSSGHLINYWIESGINTKETLVWADFSSLNINISVQTYDDLSLFYLAFGNSAWQSSASNMRAIFPSLTDNMTFWFKAHEHSGSFDSSISDWTDVYNNHAVQSTRSNQPILRSNVLNGFAGIEFDGVNDYLLMGGGYTTATQGSFYIVYKNPSPGNTKSQRLMSGSSAGSQDYTVGVYLMPALDASNVPVANPDGGLAEWIRASDRDMTNIHFGVRHSAMGNYYKGYILEAIGFYGTLGSNQSKLVKNYAQIKYGLQPSLIASIDYDLISPPR